MSWFDATGFANLAKSALKEAQKTIDKALDIKDDDPNSTTQSKVTSPNSPDETDSFFASWGLKPSSDKEIVNSTPTDSSPAANPSCRESPKSSKLVMSTSLWGSFTGSFFENPQAIGGEGDNGLVSHGSDDEKNPVSKQPKKATLFQSSVSLELSPSSMKAIARKNSWEKADMYKSLESEEGVLCDDSSEVGVEEGFSRSKLVVESEDGDLSVCSRLSSCEVDDDRIMDVDSNAFPGAASSSGKSIMENNSVKNDGGEEYVHVERRRDVSSTSNCKYNRLSVISSESDKKSSESVEVLGSASSEGGSGCTTSPESDMPLMSPHMSASSSAMGLRLSAMASSPDSVEVIPDTPSSVEVLGDESSGRVSQSTMSSSPYMSPGEPPDPPTSLTILGQSVLDSSLERCTSSSNKVINTPESDKISPESVEVIPEEEEDEDVSVADDSYTSASESTATATTTVMELPSMTFVANRTDPSGDVTKSPLHIAKLHSTGDVSSSESSLYSSTISIKAEGGESKSPSSKSFHQCMGTIDSSYSDNLLVCDVQMNTHAEGPVLTHSSSSSNSSSRSGFQLALPQGEIHKMTENNSEDDATEKEIRGAQKVSGMVKQLQIVQLHGSTSSVPVTYESSNEEGSFLSDSRTLVNTDSSGEGTVMESSSEETIVLSVHDNSASDGSEKSSLQQSSSYYVKTMLADAMGEDDGRDQRIDNILPARDQSPISSESRSDMVKVESEQTSGHTSGDELETTTSSDIEIISSPNGDSSSTQSRQSPAKLLQRSTRSKLALAVERSDSPSLEFLGKVNACGKVKGHQRELSETSSGGSEDSHYLEVEKLLKRVAEMTEILEARESKLIELSRASIELQENNSDLKHQLDAALHSRVAETQDIHQVTEEFTQRLSSLERKFQQAIRDKETLRKQLEQAKLEAASRLPASDLEAVLAEKDEIIHELRVEGEKLSKQQLQHSNIIKKLRAKEKENDNTIKNQKESLEEMNQEVERLKRSLTAKEEVERTQIEAVHQLTAKNKRLEKELQSVCSQVSEFQNKAESLKNSLEIANRELAETKKASDAKDKELKEATLSAELSARQELLVALEDVQCSAQEEREQLLSQIDELRLKLGEAEEQHTGREASVRQEYNDLLRRLEQAEARNEELAQSVSLATRPLLRQLESLQAASTTQQIAWEKQERNFTDTISDLQGKVMSLADQERSSREQCVGLRSHVSSLESRTSSSNQEIAQLKLELENQLAQCVKLKQEKEKEVATGESLRLGLTEQVTDLHRQVASLEQQLAVQRAATDAEKRRTTLLQEQLKERESLEKERTLVRGSPTCGTTHSSPTLSFGHASLSESFSSANWPQFQDDAFECSSTSGRLSNVYESLRSGNTTSLLEGLQAQLKLRDGEVQQLQWEMSRRDAERTALTSELSSLTARVEEQEQRLKEALELRRQYEDVQHKYDALLQMYGEKVEETQELRLDLQDVKEMYKTQIDQLLKKEPST